ncbi:MAG: hypothetical protein RLY47_499 [Candidatus Parcubacteria bacterium]|jgi:hypothetical protein
MQLTNIEREALEANKRAEQEGKRAREEDGHPPMSECTHPTRFAFQDGYGTRCTYCGHVDRSRYGV